MGSHLVFSGNQTLGNGMSPPFLPISIPNLQECELTPRIEAACYFLDSPDGSRSKHAEVFKSSIQELVDMIEKAQQPDGYLIIYFTVVDKEGRFKNLRDMHEMCELSMPLVSTSFDRT